MVGGTKRAKTTLTISKTCLVLHANLDVHKHFYVWNKKALHLQQ